MNSLFFLPHTFFFPLQSHHHLNRRERERATKKGETTIAECKPLESDCKFIFLLNDFKSFLLSFTHKSVHFFVALHALSLSISLSFSPILNTILCFIYPPQSSSSSSFPVFFSSINTLYFNSRQKSFHCLRVFIVVIVAVVIVVFTSFSIHF